MRNRFISILLFAAISPAYGGEIQPCPRLTGEEMMANKILLPTEPWPEPSKDYWQRYVLGHGSVSRTEKCQLKNGNYYTRTRTIYDCYESRINWTYSACWEAEGRPQVRDSVEINR